MKRWLWLLVIPVTGIISAVCLLNPEVPVQKNGLVMQQPGAPEHEEETPHVVMRQYVICYNASDCPGMYSVRKHLIFSGKTRPAELVGVTSSLSEARRLVPEGMTRLQRAPQDDPVILEVWL